MSDMPEVVKVGVKLSTSLPGYMTWSYLFYEPKTPQINSACSFIRHKFKYIYNSSSRNAFFDIVLNEAEETKPSCGYFVSTFWD